MTMTPPPELLAHILSFLANDFDSPALFACTLTSPVLSSIAQPLLYRSIRLAGHIDQQDRQQALLMRTLRSSNYGLLIRHLIFDVNESYLLDMIPHLTKLESLSLLFTVSLSRVFHTYPSPFIIALHNLTSQPGFKSLDIDDTVFQRVDDLQYLLGGAKCLKHLGLTEVPGYDTFSSYSQAQLMPYPSNRPWKARHISPESLTLGFQLVESLRRSNDAEAIPHFIPKWISAIDCVLDVRRVKRLAMINSGRYDVEDIIERLNSVLEVLELEERQREPILLPTEEDSEELPTNIKFAEWFLSTKFPNLRHISISGLPPAVETSCWWIHSIVNSAYAVAPNLETVDLKLYGDFKYTQKETSTSQSSIRRGPRDPLYDIGAMWILCVGNLVKCTKLRKLSVSLVCGQSRLSEGAVRRRRDYAKVAKMFINASLKLPDKYIVVQVYDSSGRRLYST